MSRKRLLKVVDEYNRIQHEDIHTVVRSAKITACVKQFHEIFGSYKLDKVNDWLLDHDNGKRLAAYAYLFQYPEEKYYATLLKKVSQDEALPFNAYWGLLAIRQAIGELNCDPNGVKLGKALADYDKRKIGGGRDIAHLMRLLQQHVKA